jgi:hypothetical protein
LASLESAVVNDRQRVALIFIDGLGLGPRRPSNPLARAAPRLLGNFLPADWSRSSEAIRPAALPEVERLGDLPYEGRVVATDVTLGVSGLPQSATGQTTILTGVNAAAEVGRHCVGFPGPALRSIIERASVFKQVRARGLTARFVNAYTPRFFELGEAVWSRRLSVTTWACRAGGVPFLTLDDVARSRAVYQDITHETLRARGHDLPPRAPEDAGRIFAELAATNDFVLFEFFQTDRAGHAQDEAWAMREIEKLEAFLEAVLEHLDLARMTLIVTSDHGNIEDLETRSHTANPVPTMVFGRDAGRVAGGLRCLEAVTPIIMELLDGVPAD